MRVLVCEQNQSLLKLSWMKSKWAASVLECDAALLVNQIQMTLASLGYFASTHKIGWLGDFKASSLVAHHPPTLFGMSLADINQKKLGSILVTFVEFFDARSID